MNFPAFIDDEFEVLIKTLVDKTENENKEGTKMLNAIRKDVDLMMSDLRDIHLPKEFLDFTQKKKYDLPKIV